MTSVPKTSSVIKGAAVNIVLKADQPTGRTVAGIVLDVLTRGNHPRGIKVRLTDGRVGRVKSMATDAQVRGDEPPTPAEPGDFGRRRFHDGAGAAAAVRHIGQQQEAPTSEIGLDAYIRPAKKQGRRSGALARDVSGESSQNTPLPTTQPSIQTAKCPVCLDFEGDEQAIMHHVGTHFD
ncbi:hypothetical protein TD95_003542 [Thielaviopsis punctulata]|uniref:UBZ4-type domain-containing protein n=1 Tax=Thielaviopsis punctulata TaxID=72032 RepID=A0A0F4Z6E9_9PEZI|nr:hypothetical protein TD95_003542 [Thielaviopsis punctulata]